MINKYSFNNMINQGLNIAQAITASMKANNDKEEDNGQGNEGSIKGKGL